jgi:hypothetical protein
MKQRLAFSAKVMPGTNGFFQRLCCSAAYLETGVLIELNSKHGA